MGSQIEFEKCIKKNNLRVSTDAKRLVGKELEAAAIDLREADAGLKREAFKWSTVQSYYAMFHAARALLYAKGYREKSHYCLRIAIEVLYVGTGDLSQQMVNAFEVAKELRENADYESNFSELGAKKLVAAAREFIRYAKKILSVR